MTDALDFSYETRPVRVISLMSVAGGSERAAGAVGEATQPE